MFGYVQIRKPELKIKDYEIYHGYYCGLCSCLKEQYGFLGQATLTYDMTFLVLLLSSLYDAAPNKKEERCIVHPGKKHMILKNEITEYAAHLNILLSYYHFKDDKEDEKSKKAAVLMQLYRRKKKKASLYYQDKEDTIQKSLTRLSRLEKSNKATLMELADCFGDLMACLFSYKEDVFQSDLKQLGFHLGRFIYIMDAYDDREKDEKKGCFNPLLSWRRVEDYENRIENLLLDEMADAAAAFEKLPCVSYADILRNILYAGVWNRYDMIRKELEETKREADSSPKKEEVL